MAETIEMPVAENKKVFPKKRSRTFIILSVLLLLCILAGCICWLSLGKVSTVAARIDGTVYTVGPQVTAIMQNLYVYPGEVVAQGQELAKLDIKLQHKNGGDGNSQMSNYADQIGLAQGTERELAERLAIAQREEEKYRIIKEDRVVEHVRAQLAMRSANAGAHSSYANAERQARANMEHARDEFERASKIRAATEKELAKIKALRKKSGSHAGNSSQNAAPATQPVDGAIFSPANGRVIAVNGSQGQVVQKGQPIFIILPTGQDLGPNALWVQAWFPADAGEELAHGQPATISLDSGLELEGKISEIYKAQALPPSLLAGTPETRREAESRKLYVPCRIMLENLAGVSPEKIIPGMNVKCEVHTRSLLGFRGW